MSRDVDSVARYKFLKTTKMFPYMYNQICDQIIAENAKTTKLRPNLPIICFIRICEKNK